MPIKTQSTRTTDNRPAMLNGRRPGAVGKALIVWLASGSAGLALVAYLLFAGMGC